MSTPAARQAAYRERLTAGRAKLTIEVDINGLSQALIESDFLAPEHCDDREEIARATERALGVLIKLSAGDA